MGDLGIAPDVIEKCSNRADENKVKRIYQRQKLEKEQAHAWKILGERLNLLVNMDTSNIILLHNNELT
jgi:hypothetical protein